MKRITTIFTLMLVVALFSVVLTGCGKKEKAPSNTTAVVTNNPSNSNNNEEKQEVSFNIGNEFSGDDIPLTDLSMSYKGNPTDEEGKLNAPFDVVYKEAFDTGAFKYDESAILIKMPTEYDGELLDDFKKVGITSITDFSTAKNGVWYKATLSEDVDAKTVIKQVRSLSYVLMADFDYIYESEAIKTTTPSLMQDTATVDGLITDVLQNSMVQNQWYLGACSIIDSWRFLQSKGISAGGSSSVVVAVIDTGVDYTHSDLKANMWTNSQEIPNNGRDDDGNGYVDDYYGVDICATHGGTTQDIADPMDDHGHGTHVAGIIAASNNKQGVVGIAYNAKIMAVKAGQASGIFLQSDIAQAILYAYQMGADVINMSFGGSACSIAVQDALDQAYTTSTLVASAGNDGLPNEYTPASLVYLPNYPAALSYVIGVMSVDRYGRESAFTNWDVYGYNTVEYEVYAPGEQILSTLPNERYGYLSGTSMAAPIVSAIAGLLRSYFTDRDMYPSKYIAAQICSTSELSAICLDPRLHGLHNIPMIVNGYAAFTKVPKPDVTLFNYFVYDSVSISETNNGDGIVDSGETVNLGIVLRNRWGMSKDTIVSIDALSSLGVVNPYVEILTSEINFNGVGTYSTKDNLSRNDENIVTGVEIPLTVKVSRDCPNDYLIVLNVHINCKNALDEEDHNNYSNDATLSFAIRNGVVLPSQITEDMVLTKDNYYIIPNSTYIAKGVTVTVEPGTKIQFWTNDPNDAYADSYIAYLNVAGSFIVNGSEEEPVEMFPSELMGNYVVKIVGEYTGNIKINYASIVNPIVQASIVDHCYFTQNYSYSDNKYLSNGSVYSSSARLSISSKTPLSNSVIYKIGYRYNQPLSIECEKVCNTVFFDSSIDLYYKATVFENCVFLGNFRDIDGNISTSIFGLKNRYGTYYDNTLRQIGFSGIVKNPETGTTYMLVSPTSYSGYTYYDEKIANLAKSFGGQLCIINDNNERDFLLEHGVGGYVSSYNQTNTWTDGSLIEVDGVFDSTDNPYWSHFKIFNGQRSYIIEIPGSIYLETIQLNEYTVLLDLECNYNLSPTIYPSTFEGDLIYVSSDDSILTVDENGLVTPLRKGEAYVYIYSEDYLTKTTCKFNIVEKIKTKSIKLNISNTQINIGSVSNVSVSFTPTNATERNVVYSSSDTSVATISSNGTINAVGVGTCTITAQLGELLSSIDINVVSPVESIKFEDKFYVTYLNDTDDGWMPNIYPADATNKNITWYSSNPEVAYVNENDVLVRVAEGTTTIRACVENTSYYDEINITVNNDNLVSDSKIIQIDSNSSNIFATDSQYNLWVWGGGYIRMPYNICSGYKSIACRSGGTGYCYLYAVDTNGYVDEIYISLSSKTIDVERQNVYSLDNCKKVISNNSSYYVLKNDGTVWSWGNNYGMKLGDGTTFDRNTPTQADVLNAKDIFTAYNCLYVLDSNNDLYLYGQGYHKELLLSGVYNVTAFGDYIVTNDTDDSKINIIQGNSINKRTGTGIRFKYDSYTYDSYSKTISYYSNGYTICNIFDIVYYGYENIFYNSNSRLYGFGSNYNYQLVNLSTETLYNKTYPIYFGIKADGDNLFMTTSNLDYKYSDVDLSSSIICDEYAEYYDINKMWISPNNSYTFDYSNNSCVSVSFNKNNRNDYYYNTIYGFDDQNINKMIVELRGRMGDTISFIPNGDENFEQSFTLDGTNQLLEINMPSSLQRMQVVCNKNNDEQSGELTIHHMYVFSNYLTKEDINFNSTSYFDYNDSTSTLTCHKSSSSDGFSINISNQKSYVFIFGRLDSQYVAKFMFYQGDTYLGNYSHDTVDRGHFGILDGSNLPTGCDNIKIIPLYCGTNGAITFKAFTSEEKTPYYNYSTSNKKIEIDFSSKILPYTNYSSITMFDYDGKTMSIQKELFLNKLIIKPIIDLEVGKVYTLKIPSSALETMFGASNENIIFAIKYINDMNIELLSTSIENNKIYNEFFNKITLDYSSAKEGDNYSSIVLEDSNGPIEINKLLSNGQLSISFSPAYSSYKLTIPEGALKDYVGGRNESTIINFTIADTLKLINQNVKDNDERVDENLVFSFTFNDVEQSENYNNIKLIDSKENKVEIVKTVENNVLLISHDALVQGEKYQLVIPSNSFVDQLGNTNDNIEINFSVYEPVKMLYYSSLNSDIALDQVFQFEYNGSFTLNETKAHVYVADGNDVDIIVEQIGKIIRIRTSQSLNQNSSYQLVFEEGFLVDEKNSNSSRFEFEFKTIKQEERFYITRDYLQNSYTQWKNGGYDSYFVNCAILNDLNDTNVEHWLRIQAPEGTNEFGISGNYWGTTNEYMIEKQIIDFDDYQSLADVILGSYLLEGNERMYPFITDVSIYNINGEKVRKVSNETIKVVIKFNRDMDITDNLRVRFGSSLPYAEYEIPGDFVSPRQWEGTYTLKTTIENGNQFFNITGGRADSDHFLKLYEHSGRWMFEVDTASAQAMIMQGVATSEGIELTWEQDDFDTLAGYNVYRSTREDGYYTRLNSYVLSADTKTFFDSTVEPGIVYYYNFTVVKTDLSESDPSGKISIMSLDTMAPNVYHSPVRTAYTNSNLIISATITDNLQVTNAYIYYRTKGTTEWKRATMNPINSRYTGLIPQYDLSLEGLEYYICAYDGITYTYNGTSTNPYEVIVKTAINDSQLGDVDGDGVITTKDALMLLQAVNDLLNLTEEQFLRADIDKDGVLTAQEALRILQYVSGKVTSIVG